jgi:hypothetical protein
MRIDISDAAPEQRLPINEVEYFLVRGDGRLREFTQSAENQTTLPQIAERQFASDERMLEDLPAVEQLTERIGPSAQMIDPDRGVDQDHLGFGRRRGIGFRPASLPPRRASRRALSRSISALSASRTKADFSRNPV